MSKGPWIKAWIKWYITEEALRNRDEPNEAVAQRIEDYLQDKEVVPARETILKKISAARNSPDGPKDKSWSLATLADYPLPQEAIPIVLQVWHNVQSHRSPEVVAKPIAGQQVTGPFTIREAQWVARLKFIEDIVTLEHWAHAYAIAERVSDVMGKNFDSSNMDKAILKYITYHQAKRGISNER